MNFNDRIKPFLISDDLIIQEFVSHTLHDYPSVKQDWVKRLVLEAAQNQEKASSILVFLKIDPTHEEVAKLLVDGVNHAQTSIRHLYGRLLFDLDPEIALKYRNEISMYLPNDYWELCEVLVNGTEEDVWMEYGGILNKLEDGEYSNIDLYRKAKQIAYTLVKKGWITASELKRDLEANQENEWFSYNGILVVYMIGLMKNKKYIPELASLLERDEDLLLEEVAATLISLQTDEVVREVAPYIVKEESNIFATSIVENIKTEYAVEVLRDAYRQVKDEDMRANIIEALSHQLSPEAEPEINNYVSDRPFSFIVDVEQMAYSYYKIIGMDHPFIDEWKEAIENRDSEENEEKDSLEQPIKAAKIGRNEPCPCGSGKKYKKCCG